MIPIRPSAKSASASSPACATPFTGSRISRGSRADPPRDGEGDRSPQSNGGGGLVRNSDPPPPASPVRLPLRGRIIRDSRSTDARVRAPARDREGPPQLVSTYSGSGDVAAIHIADLMGKSQR